MNDKSIILEAALDEDYLKIDIHQPDEVIWDYDYSLVPMDQVNKICKDMLETINRIGKINLPDPQLKDGLIQSGRLLCELLIHPKIEKKLRVTDADTIIAVIDDKLIHIPWELIYFDQEFLCRRFCMGRKVKTQQKLPDIKKKKSSNTNTIWIIADPSNELKNAESEGIAICQYIDNVIPQIEAVLSGRVTLDDIQNDIRQYDIIHFAGHVDYFKNDLRKNGWRLTEGRLTISDIDQMAGTVEMPSFIFANACQSALTNVSVDCNHAYPNISGMANAFLTAGVNHYIGTLWEIDDNQSRYFAICFYKYLFSGLAIGESIRLSRIDFDEEFGSCSIGWASYLLYGDPNETYIGTSKSQGEIRGKSDSASTPYKPKKIRQNINKYVLFIPVIVLLFVMYNIFNKSSDTVVIPAQVLETLEKLAISKQKEIEHLLDRIEHKMSLYLPKQSSTIDNWTSSPLTLVVDFVVSVNQLNLVKENIILSTIQEAIIKKTRFKCLERKGFSQLLKELDLSLTHPLHKLKRQPEIMTPNFFLFVSIEKINANLFIYLRLSEMNRSVYDAWYETIKYENSIGIQKNQLTQRLINNLHQIEKDMICALQGKIIHIKAQDIVINIGNDEGVFPGQIFRVVDTDTLLEIEIVQKNKSIAKIFSNDHIVKNDQKVVAEQQNKKKER